MKVCQMSLTFQETLEKLDRARKQVKKSESSIEHLRLEEFVNNPHLHCAYCEKTHLPKHCEYKDKKAKEEKKPEESKQYSWYE